MANDYTKAQYYTDWASKNDYHFNPGTFILPVAEAPPTDPVARASWSPVVAVQAHAPFETRQMTFNAQKEGTPPVVPAPVSSGCFVLVEGVVSVPGPKINQNGTKFNWEVGGTYTYVQTLRSDNLEENGLVLTGFPFPLQIQDDNRVQYGNGAVPSTGPVSTAGPDVKAGYVQGRAITLSDPYWKYNNPNYFPGVLLDAGMVNGGGQGSG